MEFLKTFNAGHLRASIALMFVIAFITGFFMGTISEEAFTATATVAIGFYFGGRRSDTKANSTEPEVQALLKTPPDVKPYNVA